MRNKNFFAALISALIFTGTFLKGEVLETISRPDIAANFCPAEWAAFVSQEPDLWADTNPIRIDPSFDQSATDVFNKYFLWVMAQAEHFSSVTTLADPDIRTPSYFRKAKSYYDLSKCLTMTPAEKDLMIKTYLSDRSSKSEDIVRAKLFEAFDEYECMGFAQASEQIFRLDSQSASFQSDYKKITSTTLKVCGQ